MNSERGRAKEMRAVFASPAARPRPCGKSLVVDYRASRPRRSLGPGWSSPASGDTSGLAFLLFLDVVEDGALQLTAGGPGAAADELLLQGGEDRLGDALSKQSPREPIETATPASRTRW